MNDPLVLLHNESGAGNHWQGIELIGKGHADVVGAKLMLDGEGRTLTRFARGGGSYLSSGDRRHLFGLGKSAKSTHLKVVWPSGQEQTWDGLLPDSYWRLAEGDSQAHKIDGSR